MTTALLEHVNLTVNDPKKTAAKLIEIFGWHVRWEGAAINNGYTVHVGTESRYIALYRPENGRQIAPGTRDRAAERVGHLNHIAIVVDNLEATEKRVQAAGYTPENHGDYEPGRRFYFYDHDDIEFEVVSYKHVMGFMEAACLMK